MRYKKKIIRFFDPNKSVLTKNHVYHCHIP